MLNSIRGADQRPVEAKIARVRELVGLLEHYDRTGGWRIPLPLGRPPSDLASPSHATSRSEHPYDIHKYHTDTLHYDSHHSDPS